jgi:transposase
VTDPFHVVRLAGDALDQCRRGVQQNLHGHRGRSGDAPFRARRMLHAGTDLLTDRQRACLNALFAADEHVEVEVSWAIYQRMIGPYRDPDRVKGRHLTTRLIVSISHNVPTALSGVTTRGWTLAKRAGDILAHFDRPRTSKGSTEATTGRLEHLRGTVLGFRNLTNYIARSLLETGGFRRQLHPSIVMSRQTFALERGRSQDESGASRRGARLRRA